MIKKSQLKEILVFISLCCVLLLLTPCAHEHVWSEATCTEPATCSECGQTRGEPLGHDWAEAPWSTHMTCRVCGQTEHSLSVIHVLVVIVVVLAVAVP